MNNETLPQTSTNSNTMNEASPAEQIEFELVAALAALKNVKDRVGSLAIHARGDLALKLADTIGALQYGIKETTDALAHYEEAEGMLILQHDPGVMEVGERWDSLVAERRAWVTKHRCDWD